MDEGYLARVWDLMTASEDNYHNCILNENDVKDIRNKTYKND